MKNLSIGHTDRFLRFLGIGNDSRIIFAEQSEFYSTEEIFVQAKPKSKYIKEMGGLIKDMIQKYELYPDKINFAIDSSLSFINTIPIDYSDDSGSINSNILWELSNYFPENYKNYKVNFLKVNGNDESENNVKNTLVISVHKDDAESVVRIAESAGIKFGVIDIDYLAAVKYYINKQKTGKSPQDLLIAGCKRGKIEISLLCDGRMQKYDYFYIRDTLNREMILKAVKDTADDNITQELSKIMIFGEENTEQIANLISSGFRKYETEITDPFESMGISDIYKGIPYDDINPNNFVPLAGLSMKG